jgi:phospholipase/carboxylesterase
MKAARKVSKAKEILFGLRHEIRKIDDFFHEAPCERVNTHVASGDMLVHEYKGDDPYSRSGYSLYVPDRTADNEIRPLIVSLHGGYGHGRDNIWTWIREARSRRLFLLCPTSTDLTWDISGRGEDASMLEEKVNMILSNYPVDRSRVLLSGFLTEPHIHSGLHASRNSILGF